MARSVHVVLHDDTDGSVAAETVRFGLDGREYLIDLSEANAHRLREVLAPWIAAARHVRPAIPGPRLPVEGDTAEIRRWALENGLPVGSRGRLPVDLREQYASAQQAQRRPR